MYYIVVTKILITKINNYEKERFITRLGDCSTRIL